MSRSAATPAGRRLAAHLARRLFLPALAVLVVPPAGAQDMSFEPDYVGRHAFESTQQRILERQARRTGSEPVPAGAGSDALDTARLRALMDAQRAALAGEYARRRRLQGRVRADAWLRAEAAERGRQDGEASRRAR